MSVVWTTIKYSDTVLYAGVKWRMVWKVVVSTVIFRRPLGEVYYLYRILSFLKNIEEFPF